MNHKRITFVSENQLQSACKFCGESILTCANSAIIHYGQRYLPLYHSHYTIGDLSSNPARL
jgi:hypothetical protein